MYTRGVHISENEELNDCAQYSAFLKNYEYDGHFRLLRELYEKHELTNVINRNVEEYLKGLTGGMM